MTELEKYELVNKAESLKDIQNAILSFADENGIINGRTERFRADLMAKGAELYFKDLAPFNVITREFGLRQQLCYLKELQKLKDEYAVQNPILSIVGMVSGRR